MWKYRTLRFTNSRLSCAVALPSVHHHRMFSSHTLPAFQTISHVSPKRHRTYINLQKARNDVFHVGKVVTKETHDRCANMTWYMAKAMGQPADVTSLLLNKSIARLILIYYDTWELPWTGAQSFGYETTQPSHTVWFYTQLYNTSRVFFSLTYVSIHQLPRLFQVYISVTLTAVRYCQRCWYFLLNLVSRQIFYSAEK